MAYNRRLVKRGTEGWAFEEGVKSGAVTAMDGAGRHGCRALGSLDIRGGVFDSMNVVAVRR
jgi:hypothetical protein